METASPVTTHHRVTACIS